MNTPALSRQDLHAQSLQDPHTQSHEDLHAQVWALLAPLTDPEIPVITLHELGILRAVRGPAEALEVVITPTYSGCPAMGQIEDDVQAALRAQGLSAKVVTQLAPVWTTDWMSPQAKDKLRAYGIAPPHACEAASHNVVQFAARALPRPPVACPQCASENTTETSHFGSTACKAMYKCLDCLEPFDYFKPY
jgi:ring-1,2-phenylacetyl-CoA epoxidase subunit PaaD